MLTRIFEAIIAFLLVCYGMFMILAWRAPHMPSDLDEVPPDEDPDDPDQTDLPNG
jgi:hypothetical protein